MLSNRGTSGDVRTIYVRDLNSESAPSQPKLDDLLVDKGNGSVAVWDGASWIEVANGSGGALL